MKQKAFSFNQFFKS